MERIVRSFASKRNKVWLVEKDGTPVVRKYYTNVEDLGRELSVYHKLSESKILHSEVIQSTTQYLDFSYLPGIPFSETLKSCGETKCLMIALWFKLVDWILAFTSETGLIQQDCNLRNYLYDEKVGTVSGIDFESCEYGTPEQAVSQICAHILANSPFIGPVIVDEILNYCSGQKVDVNVIRGNLEEHGRKIRIQRNVAAVMVSTRFFCRKKQNNEDTFTHNTKLCHLQVGNLRRLGISEIYALGFTTNESGVVNLSDKFNGIQAILDTIHKQNLLMLRLDTPIINMDTLIAQLEEHLSNPICSKSILYQDENLKPIITVYTKR